MTYRLASSILNGNLLRTDITGFKAYISLLDQVLTLGILVLKIFLSMMIASDLTYPLSVWNIDGAYLCLWPSYHCQHWGLVMGSLIWSWELSLPVWFAMPPWLVVCCPCTGMAHNILSDASLCPGRYKLITQSSPPSLMLLMSCTSGQISNRRKVQSVQCLQAMWLQVHNRCLQLCHTASGTRQCCGHHPVLILPDSFVIAGIPWGHWNSRNVTVSLRMKAAGRLPVIYAKSGENQSHGLLQ